MTIPSLFSQKLSRILFILMMIAPACMHAQQYSVLLQGGHVIDPKNGIDGVMDVALTDSIISKVAKKIDPSQAKKVIDVTGLYVTPGLIDMHGHVFAGTVPDGDLSNGFSSLPADAITFRSGVTTLVDAGCSGSKDFEIFKANVIARSKTRVLAFLNISSEGMRSSEYSDFQQNVTHMDPEAAAATAKANRKYIVGIKVAHFHSPDFVAVERAVAAGNIAQIPIMVDFGGSKPRLSLEELFLKKMRPGDIFTHVYGEIPETKESIVDTDAKKLKPFVWKAKERGIIFDVGHGAGSFRYSQAIPATKAGLYPHTISTDIHTGSMNSAMKDMLNVMSKFLALNMPLNDVIKASTLSPAKAIHREELGHLSEGAVADVTVLNVRKGKFGFYDVGNYKSIGDKKLECELTIRNGAVVYDLNARSIVSK